MLIPGRMFYSQYSRRERFLCACLCMYGMCADVCASVSMCLLRPWPWVSFLSPHPLFLLLSFWDRFSHWPGSHQEGESCWPASLRDLPGVHSSAPRLFTILLGFGFYKGSGDWTQALVHAKQALYWLSHLSIPRPQIGTFFFYVTNGKLNALAAQKKQSDCPIQIGLCACLACRKQTSTSRAENISAVSEEDDSVEPQRLVNG